MDILHIRWPRPPLCPPFHPPKWKTLWLAPPPAEASFFLLIPPLCLLSEVEVHLVIDVFPLWVELLEDLCKDIDRLLAAQSGAFGLELLQQIFSGHGLPDQITAHGLLSQLHVTGNETGRTTRQEIWILIVFTIKWNYWFIFKFGPWAVAATWLGQECETIPGAGAWCGFPRCRLWRALPWRALRSRLHLQPLGSRSVWAGRRCLAFTWE